MVTLRNEHSRPKHAELVMVPTLVGDSSACQGMFLSVGESLLTHLELAPASLRQFRGTAEASVATSMAVSVNWGVLVGRVAIVTALSCRAYTGTSDFWKLPDYRPISLVQLSCHMPQV